MSEGNDLGVVVFACESYESIYGSERCLEGGAPSGAELVLAAVLGKRGSVIIWVINARRASYTVPGGSEGTNDAMRRLG